MGQKASGGGKGSGAKVQEKGKTSMNEQMQIVGMQPENDEYQAFVDKFNPKKTTDDCYTPENIYNAVAGWVSSEYGLDKTTFVRPFWPGGDYQNFNYPDGCVVVDNPPFSIISKIINFYDKAGIKFFLFAPAMTLLSPVNKGYCGIAVGVSITYENGARIPTSFATNMNSNSACSCPELYKIVSEANKENERAIHRELPKYSYPDNVVTAGFLQKLSKYGVDFCVPKSDCERVSALDSMKEMKKTIFGKGLLVSERIAAEKAAAEKAAAEKAAAEKAAAEKAATTVWKLSKREKEIVAKLGTDEV
jgi:hypothetical protein